MQVANRSAVIRITLWLLLPWAGFTRLPAQSAVENATAACAGKNQQGSVTVKGMVFQSYRSEDGGCLQVLSGGKVVFRRSEDLTYTLGQGPDPEDNIPAVANGTDVTGRGHGDMIVSASSGGAHCCTTHYVFELEPELKLIATLQDAHDDLAHFQRATDGRYDYITADWTFAYWPNCFACSPSEMVTLRWTDDKNGGGFHLALDRMRKPAPNTAQWNKELAATRKVVGDGDANSIGTTLWQTVLNLIYTGHSDLAWKFVGAAGPKAQQKPFPTLNDFCSLLKQSIYWADLGPTLRNAPPACTGSGQHE
jgi:hypothetical protein